VRAGFGKSQRQRFADAAAGAGDESDFAIKTRHGAVELVIPQFFGQARIAESGRSFFGS
jgi:hypothetical protein